LAIDEANDDPDNVPIKKDSIWAKMNILWGWYISYNMTQYNLIGGFSQRWMINWGILYILNIIQWTCCLNHLSASYWLRVMSIAGVNDTLAKSDGPSDRRVQPILRAILHICNILLTSD
jgi:hypothetical protein